MGETIRHLQCPTIWSPGPPVLSKVTSSAAATAHLPRMPIQISTNSPTALASALKTGAAAIAKPAYLVAYASLTGGRSWCGDCRDAEPFIQKKFEGTDQIVTVVYVGQRDEWRDKENPWRKEPFLITNLPTIVKVTGEGEFEKLVEGDCYDQAKLDAFVQ